jgi:hypothetical protein
MKQLSLFSGLPTEEILHTAITPQLFTDFRTLCTSHVESVRAVLSGQQFRYRLHFNQATLVLHHGCLLTRVFYQGYDYALPAFGIFQDGRPYVTVLPEHQRGCYQDFCSLPKEILLFYFTLLKEVFRGYALVGHWEDPDTGKKAEMPVPEELLQILAEVEWNVRR